MKNKSDTSLPFPLPELPRIPSREFNLRAFGAVEGGQILNPAAYAEAIAAAHAAGGGRVVVPAGVWLTGPIHFKDRIELHLEEGAEIRFSQNPDDYLPVVLAQRAGTMLYNYSPLVYAYGCDDIALTGKGVLDGQGITWWPWKFNSPGTRMYLVDIPERGIPLEQRVFGTREAKVRPVMCQPIECERVLIEGVTLRNSPSWTIQPVWCRELTIRGVSVLNPPSPFSYNTDGTLALCHGRPGIFVMFDLSGTGEHWQVDDRFDLTDGEQLTIETNARPFVNRPDCNALIDHVNTPRATLDWVKPEILDAHYYSWENVNMCEVEPGRILVVYDLQNWIETPGAPHRNAIRGVCMRRTK